MSNIKKAFQPIIDLLESNPKAKVSEILAQARELAEAKRAGAMAYHILEDGTVAALMCSYHKKFFDPRLVEFGKKASTATGFASMTKDGNNKLAAQTKAAKDAESELLTRLTKGEIEVADIPVEQEAIAEAKSAIVPMEDHEGFDSIEDCLANSKEQGLPVE